MGPFLLLTDLALSGGVSAQMLNAISEVVPGVMALACFIFCGYLFAGFCSVVMNYYELRYTDHEAVRAIHRFAGVPLAIVFSVCVSCLCFYFAFKVFETDLVIPLLGKIQGWHGAAPGLQHARTGNTGGKQPIGMIWGTVANIFVCFFLWYGFVKAYIAAFYPNVSDRDERIVSVLYSLILPGVVLLFPCMIYAGIEIARATGSLR